MNETWKTAVGFEGIYEVSDLGRLRTTPRVVKSSRAGVANTQRRPGKVVSPYIAVTGYPTISLKIDGERKKHLVHRIVARTFVEGYADGLTVNRINGVKTDNRPENLEWVTLARNTELQWADGLVDIRGEKHPSSRLTNAQTREIDALLKQGGRTCELARLYGVSPALICKIRRGAKPIIRESV